MQEERAWPKSLGDGAAQTVVWLPGHASVLSLHGPQWKGVQAQSVFGLGRSWLTIRAEASRSILLRGARLYRTREVQIRSQCNPQGADVAL